MGLKTILSIIMVKKFERPKGPCNLIAVMGDEDTVTGFLLAGIGNRDSKARTNYFVYKEAADSKDIQQLDEKFKEFVSNPSIAMIIINQNIASLLRPQIVARADIVLPSILEIPSKDSPYQPNKD